MESLSAAKGYEICCPDLCFHITCSRADALQISSIVHHSQHLIQNEFRYLSAPEASAVGSV